MLLKGPSIGVWWCRPLVLAKAGGPLNSKPARTTYLHSVSDQKQSKEQIKDPPKGLLETCGIQKWKVLTVVLGGCGAPFSVM